MPLGDRQENDLVHITLDVWQDKVYYLGKEYPAGYFAAGVLNVSHNLFVTITGEGGFLLDAYAIAKFGDREQLEELLPGAVALRGHCRRWRLCFLLCCWPFSCCSASTIRPCRCHSSWGLKCVSIQSMSSR